MSNMLPEPELRAQFARRRFRQILVVVPVLLAVIAVRAGERVAPSIGLSGSVVMIGGLVLIMGALVFSLYNWRCPKCEKYLGKTINPAFCGRCGFKLRE